MNRNLSINRPMLPEIYNIFLESKRHTMSDWFLRRWDPFDLDWSLYRHFEEIDRLMDRNFRRFEEDMQNTRQKMLQDIKSTQNLKPALTP